MLLQWLIFPLKFVSSISSLRKKKNNNYPLIICVEQVIHRAEEMATHFEHVVAMRLHSFRWN
jgi:hypothetical protein